MSYGVCACVFASSRAVGSSVPGGVRVRVVKTEMETYLTLSALDIRFQGVGSLEFRVQASPEKAHAELLWRSIARAPAWDCF